MVALTYGHLVLKGETDKEILFSSYLCHPSMANNELSGPLVMAFLYQKIAALKNRKYTYRFVLAPETIGVIAYLSKYGM
jgi:aminopeptidase-like protein